MAKVRDEEGRGRLKGGRGGGCRVFEFVHGLGGWLHETLMCDLLMTSLIPSTQVGGLGDVVTALGRAVKDQGHNVEVILPK